MEGLRLLYQGYALQLVISREGSPKEGGTVISRCALCAAILSGQYMNATSGTPKRRRKPFSRAVRHAVLARTDGRCYSCGLAMTMDDDWWVEHILPHSHAGSDEVPNLLPSCRLCNFVRSNRSPTEVRKMLLIGYALMPEVRKDSELGRVVVAFLEKREARLKKKRKHAVLAMNEDVRNTIRAYREEEPIQ